MKRFVVRFLFFSFLWWVLTEGDLHDLYLALAGVLAASVTSFFLIPKTPLRLRPLGVLRFIPYFLMQSLVGGVDVARRALSPAMPLEPGCVHYHIRLEPLTAQVIFTWTVSLLPGIASIDIDERELTVHALDTSEAHDVAGSLQELEERVSRLFVNTYGRL